MRNWDTTEDLLKLFPAVLIGAEGEEEEDDDSSNEGKPAADGGNSQDEEQQEQESGKEDSSNLLKALQAERKARAAAEKKAKAAEKAEAARALAEKTELEQAEIRLKEHETRLQALAGSLLNRDLNDAIRRAAEASKFIDTTDAIDGVDRNLLVYEQDDEDPTQVTIDQKSVDRAVKDLATRKPHFIRLGTDDGNPSGSQFGGGKGGNKDDREKRLREKYPTLGG